MSFLGHQQTSETTANFTNVSGSGRNLTRSTLADNGGVAAGRDLFAAPSFRNVNNTGTISITDGAEEIALLSSQFNNSFANLANASNLALVQQSKTLGDQIKGVFDDALNKISSLAENKVTDGFSGMSKSFLLLVLGGLVIGGYWWVKKGK